MAALRTQQHAEASNACFLLRVDECRKDYVMIINVGIHTQDRKLLGALAATHLSRHFIDWKNCPTSVDFPI
jgi:hypothetical protein